MVGVYGLKRRTVVVLEPVIAGFVRRGVGADAVTCAGVAAAGSAGLAVWVGAALGLPVLWVAAVPLLVLRLLAAAVDGAVARRAGTSSATGAVRNEVADRVADVLVLCSLAAVTAPVLAAGAVAAAALTAHAGVLDEVHTGRRATGGPMGKADRVATVAVAAAVAALTGSRTPFTVAASVIAAGGLVTAALRLGSLHRRLTRQDVGTSRARRALEVAR